MGLNDPQWGRKKGNSGPPDLDQLWRNFNKKLNSLFKRKRGGGGPGGEGPGAPTPRQYGGGIGVLVALLLVLWIASGFYIVNEGQRGIVLRFGKYVESTQAGLRWHLPYPIEVVEAVNVSQVRTVEIGYRNNVRSKVLKESLMLTDDENIIDIQFAVQYILKNFFLTIAIPRMRYYRRRKPPYARSSARARWTSCSMRDANRWLRRRPNSCRRFSTVTRSVSPSAR